MLYVIFTLDALSNSSEVSEDSGTLWWCDTVHDEGTENIPFHYSTILNKYAEAIKAAASYKDFGLDKRVFCIGLNSDDEIALRIRNGRDENGNGLTELSSTGLGPGNNGDMAWGKYLLEAEVADLLARIDKLPHALSTYVHVPLHENTKQVVCCSTPGCKRTSSLSKSIFGDLYCPVCWPVYLKSELAGDNPSHLLAGDVEYCRIIADQKIDSTTFTNNEITNIGWAWRLARESLPTSLVDEYNAKLAAVPDARLSMFAGSGDVE